METWITSIMADFGYIGIFVLIMVENLFPPIPSEIILTFGGFMTTVTSLNVVMVIIVATLGSVVGAILLYKVASYFGKERLTKIVLKYGRILRLKESDIERAESFFLKYGSWAVFFMSDDSANTKPDFDSSWDDQDENVEVSNFDDRGKLTLEYSFNWTWSCAWGVME